MLGRPETDLSTSGYREKKIIFLIFDAPNLAFFQVIDLKFIYVLDTNKI